MDREYLKWLIEDLYIVTPIGVNDYHSKTHIGEMLELINDKDRIISYRRESDGKIVFGPVFGCYRYVITFNCDGTVEISKEEHSTVFSRSNQVLNDIDIFLTSIKETCGEVVYSNILKMYDKELNEIRSALKNTSIPSATTYSNYIDLKREICRVAGKTKINMLTDFLKEQGIKIDDKLIQELAQIADEERIKDGYE